MGDPIRIGVGKDAFDWHVPLIAALEDARTKGADVVVETIDLHSADWVDHARGFDGIVWNPGFMGPVSASFFKEKVYFLENYCGVRIIPNYASVWTFESKVAQSYLLAKLDVPRPDTVVSFEYEDAREQAKRLGLPLVAKKSYGASSGNVALISSQAELDRYLERAFAQELWDRRKAEGGKARLGPADATSPWLVEKVRRRLTGGERHGYVYLQEFLPGNDRDCRINVIGRRISGAYRLNREGDFRASGSGLIVRGHDLPRDAMELCMSVRDRIGADCLAMDILRKGDEPIVIEMSYSETPHTTPAYWVRSRSGMFQRIEGEVTDQYQWARHVLDVFEQCYDLGG